MGHEVLAAEPCVDVNLAGAEKRDGNRHGNKEQESSRHAVEQTDQGAPCLASIVAQSDFRMASRYVVPRRSF